MELHALNVLKLHIFYSELSVFWRLLPKAYNCSINGKEPLVMTCVWGMFWHMSGI